VAQIDTYLIEVLEKRGSDLHFIAGDPPRIRLYGDISPLKPDKLAAEFVKHVRNAPASEAEHDLLTAAFESAREGAC